MDEKHTRGTIIDFIQILAIEKIGDWKKLEILVQNQSF